MILPLTLSTYTHSRINKDVCVFMMLDWNMYYLNLSERLVHLCIMVAQTRAPLQPLGNILSAMFDGLQALVGVYSFQFSFLFFWSQNLFSVCLYAETTLEILLHLFIINCTAVREMPFQLGQFPSNIAALYGIEGNQGGLICSPIMPRYFVPRTLTCKSE